MHIIHLITSLLNYVLLIKLNNRYPRESKKTGHHTLALTLNFAKC